MKNILIIFYILLFSCSSDKQQSEKITSPSKKYYLTTTVNSSDKSKDDYADVVIHLYNTSGQLKFSLNTKAGDFSKWAVGWDNKNDTMILFSSDIGTYAWKIEHDSLKTIDITDNIKEIAKDIKNKKYSNNVRLD